MTGSPALAADGAITFIAPASSKLETPHLAVHDEERITLAAGVTLTAIATPGHTPDHHVYLLEHGGTPTALFTGGSLMVGAVGRTDLCGPELAEPLAHDMFHSLRRLDGLPDDLAVYPTHGAGSFCSAPGGADRTTTLGRERATNHLFRVDDEDTFVEQLLAGFGSFPTYFTRLPELNRRGPRRYAQLPQLDRLDVDTVEPSRRRRRADRRRATDRRLRRRARARFDVERAATGVRQLARLARRPRTPDRHRRRRRPGSRRDRPPMPRHRPREHRRRARRRHRRLASSRSPDHRDPTRRPGRRSSAPWSTCASAASSTPATSPARSTSSSARSPTTALPDGPITVMCGHGERAMTGASILTARGHRDVSVLDGGPDTWAAWSGQPLAVGR